MVQSGFSFNSAENMVPLLCLMDPESKIFPRMTLGRKKCAYYATHVLEILLGPSTSPKLTLPPWPRQSVSSGDETYLVSVYWQTC